MSKLVRSPKFGVVISRKNRIVTRRIDSKEEGVIEISASEPSIVANNSRSGMASGLFLSQKKTADLFD